MKYTILHHNKFHLFKYLLLFVLILFIAIGSYFLGKYRNVQSETTPSKNDVPPISADENNFQNHRRLHIDAIANENAGFTTIKPEQLGGNFDEDILYVDLTDVNIAVDGVIYPLENAIRDGLISVEEIFAYARIDARNGICTETYTSEHGLAYFTYRYPEFDLRMTYDVYETPDGKTHLINDMGIYKVGSNITSSYFDDETGKRIDREDWGLTFEVEEATSTSVTLNCTQSGGQHIGDLVTNFFWLYTEDYQNIVSKLPGIENADQFQPKITIEQDAVSQFTIDWTDTYGSIPSGEYIMRLHIDDVFEESQVHPLMDDFFDIQYYDFSFTIP